MVALEQTLSYVWQKLIPKSLGSANNFVFSAKENMETIKFSLCVHPKLHIFFPLICWYQNHSWNTLLHGWRYITRFPVSGCLGWLHRISWFLVSGNPTLPIKNLLPVGGVQCCLCLLERKTALLWVYVGKWQIHFEKEQDSRSWWMFLFSKYLS